MSFESSSILSFTDRLTQYAESADAKPIWPEQSWQTVRDVGALEWCIPKQYGGQQLDAEGLLKGYEMLAGACLTSCFILSQRDAACRRLLASSNTRIADEFLPKLASGEQFATVGLSQLTTSRQHGKPVFAARESGEEIIFHGTIPWVTGADHAKHIVVGATLENDNRQVLAWLPTNAPGVSIGEPMPLLALAGSLTTQIVCHEVRLPKELILAGPVEGVMKGAGGGAGGLQTSCLALGLAGAAISYLGGEAKQRGNLASGYEKLHNQLMNLRREMYCLIHEEQTPERLNALRAKSNTLVVQSAQAAMIAAKGSGFVFGHPAERWVRQAMFFLVWSCPWPAASATLDYLAFHPEVNCL